MVDDTVGEYRAVWTQKPPGYLQTEGVESGERGQVRGREGGVGHVEVFDRAV